MAEGNNANIGSGIRDIQSRVEGLLRKKSSAFEDKLFNDGRGGTVDRLLSSRAAGYYKYPYDLLTDPSHQSIMCIEIWENNPQFLSTKREAFAKFGESILGKLKGAQKAAEANATPEEKSDVMGMVTNAAGALLSGVGVIFDTAKQAFAGSYSSVS